MTIKKFIDSFSIKGMFKYIKYKDDLKFIIY